MSEEGRLRRGLEEKAKGLVTADTKYVDAQDAKSAEQEKDKVEEDKKKGEV